MSGVETLNYTPLSAERSARSEEIRHGTSFRAGKIVMHKYIPVLREDSVQSGRCNFDFEMMETVRPLANAVQVKVQVHFVPYLAFERFSGMDSLNRSYAKKKERVADALPVPFAVTSVYNSALPFWRTAGIQEVDGSAVNAAPLEAYNVLVNWMRSMRSSSLPVRTLYDTTLAEAFWSNSDMMHIKPNFDQAMMDGEVDLILGGGGLPLSASSANIVMSPTSVAFGRTRLAGAGGALITSSGTLALNNGVLQAGAVPANAKYDPNTTLIADLAGITAQLAGQGLKLSLANLEMAKQTAAFAKIRESYAGIDEVNDDYIIDMLMMGLRVPDEAMKQPILLDSKTTIFGYNERFATDGANLDTSVTTGKTRVSVSFRLPPVNSGGVILITSQVVPEALWERKQDSFLRVTDPSQFPQFDRDFLDPEKVEIVQNRQIDVQHATPNGTFGYAPLNHTWNRSLVTLGGKYFRQLGDAFNEDRTKFWTVEQLNPALNTDFFLVNGSLSHEVFADTAADPFEVFATGSCSIVGLTVFGKGFEERDNAYSEVNSVIPKTRIVQP